MSQIQVPKGWSVDRFGDLIELKHGHQFRSHDYTKSTGYKILKIGQLEKGNKLDLSNCDLVSKDRLDEFKDFIVKKGDILMALTGATLGRTVRVEEDIGTVFQNYRVGNFLLKTNQIIPEFLFYLLQSNFLMKQVFNKINRAAQPNIGKENFENTKIIYPTNKEIQKKIVQKLDSILEQIEEKKKGVLELQTKFNPTMFLEKYRLYILDKATSGYFTEQWRKKNPNVKFDLSILNDIDKKNDLIPFTNEFPSTWFYGKLKMLSELITKGASPKWQGIHYVEKGTLFITSENVRMGELRFEKRKYVENGFNEKQKRSILQKGDLLTNIVGASIGRSAIFDLDEKSNINQAVALIRLKDGIDRKYILNVLNSQKIIKFMHEEKVDAARANLSLGNVSNFPIPLPPLAEQIEIVKIVDKKSEEMNFLKSKINNTIKIKELLFKNINKISESILEKTFSGKLLN